jgi:hypothetical protein
MQKLTTPLSNLDQTNLTLQKHETRTTSHIVRAEQAAQGTGVRQESLFYFFGNKAELEAMRGYGGPEILLEGDYSWAVRVSAFTVAEIGEMLPPGMPSAHGKGMKWICFNEFKRSPQEGYLMTGDTETDARAKMLIYLLENKLITL